MSNTFKRKGRDPSLSQYAEKQLIQYPKSHSKRHEKGQSMTYTLNSLSLLKQYIGFAFSLSLNLPLVFQPVSFLLEDFVGSRK